VGSAYARLFEQRGVPHAVVTRENYGDYVGKACDVLINANGNSVKWLADKEPVKEFDASVRSVRASLEDFKAGTYVFLSSCDVYPNPSDVRATSEDAVLDTDRQSVYGFHKRLAELCVQRFAPRWLIFRMGGFVGPGLKKNPVFDILNDRPLWVSLASRLQYMHTDDAARLAWDVIGRAAPGVYNLCGGGTVLLSDVHRRAGSRSAAPDNPDVHYEINIEKLQGLFPVPPSEDAVFKFLETVKAGAARAG